ncbi:MAG: hypothetical protein CM15mP120_09240 [Pseudomonadota bacterium]|nr:MAG: hypothetical protein CM15mP120_09240 [Pseudomonadota bacterium]
MEVRGSSCFWGFDQEHTQGGPYAFVADAYFPTDSMRGNLQVGTGRTLNIGVKLREGFIFPPPGSWRPEFVADGDLFLRS